MGVLFDSHRPLQILKDLRGRVGFHYFQNINFAAKFHRKFGANIVERNLTGISEMCCSTFALSRLQTADSRCRQRQNRNRTARLTECSLSALPTNWTSFP